MASRGTSALLLLSRCASGTRASFQRAGAATPATSVAEPSTARCTCSSMSRAAAFSTSARVGSTRPGLAIAEDIPRRKRTILDLQNLKRKGIPITVLTAHDYPSARFVESAGRRSTSLSTPAHAGVDICLVGDSLAMVACGYDSTSPLGMDEMVFHCRSVARGCKSSFLVGDMPFGSYQTSLEQGIANAVRIVQEGKMDAVKIEGGVEIVGLIKRLTELGIPVMGHVGLTPQRQASLSGYRVQGKTAASAEKVWKDALAVQEAGAFAAVVEAVPTKLGRWMSRQLTMPTIGIGAGVGTDGQVLVQMDMLGVHSMAKGPRFVKRYAELEQAATEAVGAYVDEVREGKFPAEEHSYGVGDKEWGEIVQALGIKD